MMVGTDQQWNFEVITCHTATQLSDCSAYIKDPTAWKVQYSWNYCICKELLVAVFEVFRLILVQGLGDVLCGEMC